MSQPQSWGSYPSIFSLGHRALRDLGEQLVNVEEKVDGSQFSCCRREDGAMLVRSKGAMIDCPPEPSHMFRAAVDAALTLDLTPGWTYRMEYLRVPKHNTLRYSRIPRKHLILFDVSVGFQDYLPYPEKEAEACRLGLDVVPLLGVVMYDELTLAYLKKLLNMESVLGGPMIEGIVVKPRGYDVFGVDKRVLMGKFVSEEFKEKHKHEWKTLPGKGDIVSQCITALKTEARWRKAVQHLREQGVITDSPKDIGAIIAEIKQDIVKEESEWLKEQMFKDLHGAVLKGVTAGVAEWYKGELVKQLEKEGAND